MLKDRVKVFTNTSGTGVLTLGDADSGFQSFDSLSGQTYYAITNGINWEVGAGTCTSGYFYRDSVLDSSNSGNLISLSGKSTVFVTYPAAKAVYSSLSSSPSSGDLLFKGNVGWDSRPLSSGDVISALGYSPSSGSINYSANSGIVLSNDNFSMGGTGVINSLKIKGDSSNPFEIQNSFSSNLFSVAANGFASGGGLVLNGDVPAVKTSSLYASGEVLYWQEKRVLQNKIVEVSGEYNLNGVDSLVIVNSGTVNLFEPSGTTYTGLTYRIKSLINNAQISPASGTVDGSSGAITMKRNDCYQLSPSDSGWHIISKYSEFVDGNL